MRRTHLALIILILAGCLTLFGCTNTFGGDSVSAISSFQATASPTIQGTPADDASSSVLTPDDLISFISEAREFALKNGTEQALEAFNDQNGRFVRNGIYIFAERYDGTALAEPLELGLIGTNILNMTDRFGVPLILNLGETARYGIGYVSYDYPNPSQNGTVEPKLSVVADVDGTYYLGAGMYTSSGMVYPSVVLNTTIKAAKEDDLTQFVKRAVAYAHANGKEKALAAFNNPQGPFVQGELVIMAFDFNGTNLASPPYAPELAKYNINLINYHDLDGVATIREMRDLAKSGGGISYTVARVTCGGRDLYLPKIDYAEPVDDAWWLFSGIIDPDYVQAASGNLTGIMIRDHSREELYSLVDRAVQYAKTNGKDETLVEISNPNGQFVNGDLFVWAESANGTVLADPFWKEGVGKNFLDYTDPYGQKTTQVGLNALNSGTGFTHQMFPDTSRNSSIAIPKLVYMKAVDDTWWIGSGIYGIQTNG